MSIAPSSVESAQPLQAGEGSAGAWEAAAFGASERGVTSRGMMGAAALVLAGAACLFASRNANSAANAELPTGAASSTPSRLPQSSSRPNSHQKLSEKIADLAQERDISMSDVVGLLMLQADNNECGLTNENLSTTLESAAGTTKYLSQARELAAAWLKTSPPDVQRKWAEQIVNSRVTGGLFIRPSIEDGDINLSYALTPSQAREAGVEWQDVRIFVVATKDGNEIASSRCAISMIPGTEEGVNFAAFPLQLPAGRYEVGMDLIITAHIAVWGGDLEKELGNITRTIRYKIIESSGAGGIDAVQLDLNGQDISAPALQINAGCEIARTVAKNRGTAKIQKKAGESLLENLVGGSKF